MIAGPRDLFTSLCTSKKKKAPLQCERKRTRDLIALASILSPTRVGFLIVEKTKHVFY